MSDIVPPSLGVGGGVTQTTPAGIVGAVINPPQAIAQLPSGVIVHGTVIRLDGRHRAVVRTDLGSLEITSNALLSVGNQVTLQIRTAGSQLHVVILQVDGHPAHALPADTLPAAGPAATPPHDGQGDVLVLGQRLEAILQSLPSETAGLPGNLPHGPALSVGSRFQIRVLQVLGPDHPPVDPAAPPRVDGTMPKTPTAAATRTVPAVVKGSTTTGEPVVDTSVGVLTLGATSALPSGTRLLLELPATGLAPGQDATTQAPHNTALAFGWPALDTALQVLEKTEAPVAPAGTPATAGSAVPKPGPRLTSTILFFLQALSGGDLRGWLGGPAVEALQSAGRGDLVSRLSQDFAQLARLSEAAGGDWRLLAIPLVDGNQVQQLRLFLRRRHSRPGHGADDKSDSATRFVLEVALASFGDLQLDGLVREQRFDLILRSRRPLSSDMRRDIAAIFNEANDVAGHSGQISFQASGHWTFMAVESGRTASGGLMA